MEHPSIYRLGGWRGIDKNEKTEKKKKLVKQEIKPERVIF